MPLAAAAAMPSSADNSLRSNIERFVVDEPDLPSSKVIASSVLGGRCMYIFTHLVIIINLS
jgi:hypothetical protein